MTSVKPLGSSRLRSRPTKHSTSSGSVVLRKSEVAVLKRGKKQISVSAQKAFSSLKQKVDADRGRR